MKGVYLLQTEDSPTSDTEGNDGLLISLNAMSSTETMQLHVRVMEATLTRGPGGLRVDTLHLGGRGEPPGSPARAPGRPYGGNHQRQSCG
jgi:hypothetical protein